MVKFQNKLCHRLKIIPFKPNSNLEAFKLFEGSNDRGLAVSGIDLFKNNCLQRAINDPQTKDIHDKWQDVFENTLITQNPSIFYELAIIREMILLLRTIFSKFF